LTITIQILKAISVETQDKHESSHGVLLMV